jgi:hypothetical protein
MKVILQMGGVFKGLKEMISKNYGPPIPGFVWAIATCVLLVSACNGGPEPPPWQGLITKAPTSEPTPAVSPVATSNHLVVYLDTSASMAGYVSADRAGQTVFSRSLQELRNFITIITPPIDVVVKRVDSTISGGYPDSYLSEASLNRDVFTGKETDLAGAISLFEKSVVKSEKASNKDDDDKNGDEVDPAPLPPARFHVLVTDGVQSRTNQSADASCLAGSDQTCVRKRILMLISKGWGSYVIGIRSDFQGNVYSEVSRRSVVSYQSKRRDPESFRPFYIYLFSPDRPALDGLVSVLISRLRPLLAREDGIRTLSLTSAYSEGPAQAEVKVAKESTSMLSESKPGRHQTPPGFTLRVDIGSDKKGPVPFQISTTLPWAPNVRDGGTPKELAELVTWKVVPVNVESESNKNERARYPEIKITHQQIEADGRVVLNATAQYPGGVTGKPAWRSYRLEGWLNLDQQIPPWIRQWSTNIDTTPDTANKTLYLESTLLGLWNNPVLKKHPVAEIYFRIGP